MEMQKNKLWKLLVIIAIPLLISLFPAPEGLSKLAWVLSGIYLAAIVGLVIKPFAEPVVLLIAVAASMVVVGNLGDGFDKSGQRVKRIFIRYHLVGVFCIYSERGICHYRIG